MGWQDMKIPVLGKDVRDLKQNIKDRLQDPKIQKRVVLVIVSIALLLDNMLYMVIVPIIPIYFRAIGVFEKEYEGGYVTGPDGEDYWNETAKINYIGEDSSLGFLFASKAIVQICVGPFSGTIIDRIGYELPMMFGLTVMFLSTSIFALGSGYWILFFARALQGVGSAFADTSGLAMIADRFKEEEERSKALGIALAFISFGCLVAPPFGSILYDWFGKPVPFVILSLVCLADAVAVFMVIDPKKKVTEHGEPVKGTPIWKLFMDPYIAVCSGALIMANVSLAFLEPTITPWMRDTMPSVTKKEMGLIWLPPFFPHVLGVYFTVVMMKKYPRHIWVLAAVGLTMEGLSCIIVPYAKSFWVLTIPLCMICFGIALIDTSLLPMLGYLVDTRHTSVYGSVYAIADISYSLAYAFGPIIAGEVVEYSSFYKLNIGICVSNLLYVPALFILRSMYAYKSFENERDALQEYEEDNFERFDGGVAEHQTIVPEGHKTYGALSPSTENGTYGQGDGYGTDGYAGYGHDSIGPGPQHRGKPQIDYQQAYPQPDYPSGRNYYDQSTAKIESQNDPPGPRRGYEGL